MLCMKRITAWLATFLLWMTYAHAVPPVLNYAGKVAVDGEAYDGDGFFKFALVNEDFYAKKSFLKPQDFLVKSYIPEG